MPQSTVTPWQNSLRGQANVNLTGGYSLKQNLENNKSNVHDSSHLRHAGVVSGPLNTSKYPNNSRIQPGSGLTNSSGMSSGNRTPNGYIPRNSVGNRPSPSPGGSISPATIIGERIDYVEVPKSRRVMKEKLVKKKRIVPEEIEEEVQHNDVIEIKEKIIELAPSQVEPRVVVNEIVKERKVKRQEIIEKKLPKIEYRERIVEDPDNVEYVDVVHERIVEIPQIKEDVKFKKVKVPQYVDRYTPKYVDIDQPVEVHRRIPKPVAVETEYEFDLPTLKPKYKRKELPIYAPRFVEVPVPAELMDQESQKNALHLREQIHTLAAMEAPALAEIEKIANYAKNIDFQSHMACTNYQKAIENAWRNKQLTIQNGVMQSVGDHPVQPNQQQPFVSVYGVPNH